MKSVGIVGSFVLVIASALLGGCGDASGTTTDNLYAPYDTASASQATDPSNAAPSNGTGAGTTTSSQGQGGNGSTGTGSTGSGTTPANDAGTTPAPTADAGTDAATAPSAGAFTGASAFVATTGPSTIKSSHNFPNNDPVKQACLGCHSFTFGGSVFSDVAGTMPAAGVEIRMIDANGVAHSSYTDANGNFFLQAGTLAGPAKIGVRDATTTHLMNGTIANGNCNSSSCHGGAQGFIHVP